MARQQSRETTGGGRRRHPSRPHAPCPLPWTSLHLPPSHSAINSPVSESTDEYCAPMIQSPHKSSTHKHMRLWAAQMKVYYHTWLLMTWPLVNHRDCQMYLSSCPFFFLPLDPHSLLNRSSIGNHHWHLQHVIPHIKPFFA